MNIPQIIQSIQSISSQIYSDVSHDFDRFEDIEYLFKPNMLNDKIINCNTCNIELYIHYSIVTNKIYISDLHLNERLYTKDYNEFVKFIKENDNYIKELNIPSCEEHMIKNILE